MPPARGSNSGAGAPPPSEEVIGYIEPVEINLEMERSFLEYSMSVIVSRALPDVRDGLKPVHRRILYSMFDQGLRPDRPFAKCAKVVGDVMGTYHPHGDSAIYDAMVRMVVDFSMRHPLISGHGNFGGTGPDEGAAAIERQRRADHHDRIDALGREFLGGRDDGVERRIIAVRRKVANADAARDEAHAGIHDRPFEWHFVGSEGNDEADGDVALCVQLLTRIGPVPCGRSPSLMMPRRLATSV